MGPPITRRPQDLMSQTKRCKAYPENCRKISVWSIPSTHCYRRRQILHAFPRSLSVRSSAAATESHVD